jgi:hypothetical protein
LRKLIPLCAELAPLLGEPGWRQATHLKKKAKQLVRGVAQISASKSPRVQATLIRVSKHDNWEGTEERQTGGKADTTLS